MMPADRYETASEAANRLFEEGLTLIPLGSPFEQPPRWHVERCKTMDDAREKWPKTPRVKWHDYQHAAVPDVIMQGWLRNWPDCNWAILTGKELVVIDADSDEAMAWVESGAITRPQRWVDTSKGRHYYYARNPSLEVRNSVGKAKIDIRGYGGYVVAPGSVHASGVVYTEHRNEAWPDCSADGLPPLTGEDLAAINLFNGGGASTVDGQGNLVFSAGAVPGAAAPVGMRNNTIAATTGSAIRKGMSLAEIMNAARSVNATFPEPLAEGEVHRTAVSIIQTHLRNNPTTEIPVEPVPAIPQGTALFGHVGEFMAKAGPIDWLVKGYWPRDSVAMLFGESGAGKSFVSMDLAACVATGLPWMGQRTKQGAVFYIAGEGENGMGRRFLAWQLTHDVQLAKAPLFISYTSVPLLDLRHAQQLREIIQTMADLHGVHPELIVIDTLAKNFGGGDENAQKDMGEFIDHVTDYLRRPFGACVVVVHHTGHGSKDRARGSYALPAGIDVNYRLAETESGTIELANLKMKDGPAPKPIHLALEVTTLPFTDEDGEPETSCYPVRREPVHIDLEALTHTSKTGTNKAQALDTLANLYTLHRANLAATGRPDGVPRVLLRDWRIACDMKTNRFTEVRRALEADGAIEVDGQFVLLAGNRASSRAHEQGEEAAEGAEVPE